MTLQQLEYVVALDTYRHFVTAAEKCFVTQPTITTQVKKLESEIGIAIFDRTSHPLLPTKAGEVFIIKAKMILREVSELKNMVNKEIDSLDGTFKIGVIPTISPYLIPLIAGAFSTKHPNTILQIEEMQSDYIIKALHKKEIDLGILVTPIDEPFIREVKLYNEPFVFYAQKNHPLSKNKFVSSAEIEQLNDLWLLNEGHCFRNQVLNICTNFSSTKNIQFQSGSIEGIKKMVDNYGGYTLVPEMAISKDEKGKTIHFKEPKPIREVSIIVHHSFAKEALIDAIRVEVLSKTPASFEKNKRFMKVKWR